MKGVVVACHDRDIRDLLKYAPLSAGVLTDNILEARTEEEVVKKTVGLTQKGVDHIVIAMDINLGHSHELILTPVSDVLNHIHGLSQVRFVIGFSGHPGVLELAERKLGHYTKFIAIVKTEAMGLLINKLG